MSSLRASEAKFLLKLLGCNDYQGKIAELSPSSKTSASERNRICETLGSKGLVQYDSEVARFALAPPGRTLLSLDTTSLPVTPDELKVLKACKGSMTPGRLGSKIPASTKQQLIKNLADRKMLKITKSTIKEVWLTARGTHFLCHEYEPSGSHSVGTADMMANYVRFLRKGLSQAATQRSLPERVR